MRQPITKRAGIINRKWRNSGTFSAVAYYKCQIRGSCVRHCVIMCRAARS